MNKILLAGLTAVGLLAGGGSATALTAAGAPAAAASTAAVVSSISERPSCGPLGSLVAKGTITQAQAIAIHNGFISYMHDHWQTMLGTVLGQLVRNHTMTQAQASAVTTEITRWMQMYRGSGSGHHGPCQHSHGMDMMGGSGSR
jgi:hypothetical protein